MTFLVDGYNVLFAAGLIPRGTGPGTLHRARRRLLDYLLHHLLPEEVEQTTVVFDAKDAPPDRESDQEHRGLRVLFARSHDEADDLIEDLIRRESAPRRLVVVTSDLRLRTAARRRRARSIKSETWLDQLERRSQISGAGSPPKETTCDPRRPAADLTEDEIAGWLDEFGIEE